MNDLLTGDWHLTDNPLEEYRWRVFDSILAIHKEKKIDRLFILGDAWDRKDRHTGELLNRFVMNARRLTKEEIELYILQGNHDAPLKGVSYWEFLSDYSKVNYVDKILDLEDVILLPSSKNPLIDWRDVYFKDKKAIFIHQTVDGAMVERDYVLKADAPLPVFPKGIPVFSGDVHRPQKVGPVTYVGTPHPTRFGEDWPNQVVLVEAGDYKNPHPIPIKSIERVILDIKDWGEVPARLGEGDQVRIRFYLTKSTISEWPKQEEKIKEWAKKVGVIVVSLEPILTEVLEEGHPVIEADQIETLPPLELVKLYGEEEEISDSVLKTGIDIVKAALA